MCIPHYMSTVFGDLNDVVRNDVWGIVLAPERVARVRSASMTACGSIGNFVRHVDPLKSLKVEDIGIVGKRSMDFYDAGDVVGVIFTETPTTSPSLVA